MRLPPYEKIYYIAVQDGRSDNREFDTEEEAEKARSELPEWVRKNTCVMAFVRRVKSLVSN